MTHPSFVSRCSRVVVSMPITKAASFVLVGLCLLSLTGCSTLVNGKHQALIINSNPPGATFEVDGITGVTPGTAKVERGRTDHTVVIHKPGYQPTEVKVGRKVNPWLAGNILLSYGGFIGLVVDYHTGAAYELGTANIQTTLKPEHGVPLESPTPQVSAKDSQDSKSVSTNLPAKRDSTDTGVAPEKLPQSMEMKVDALERPTFLAEQVSKTVTANLTSNGDSTDAKVLPVALSQSMEMKVDALERPTLLEEHPAVRDTESSRRPLSVSAFAGTLAGFRAGWEFSDEFGLEWNSGFNFGTVNGGMRGMHDLDVLWYPMPETVGGALRPYVLAGLGFGANVDLLRVGSVAPIGAGVKWAISDWCHLRFDLRHYFYLSEAMASIPGLEQKNRPVEATGGFDITF